MGVFSDGGFGNGGMFEGGAIGGFNNNVLGGPFKEPGRMKDVWSQILQAAQSKWEGATNSEIGRIGQSQQQTMGGFAPYSAMFSGMAQPYGQGALQGFQGFQNLLSNPSSVLSDPLYTARLSAGQKAIENSAAARGMQLSGSNLLEQGDFASNLAADTINQRLGQYGQQFSMGMGGLGQGVEGLSGIANIGMGYDAMLNQALFGGLTQQTDIMGAQAQANSAAELGYLNALTENRGAHLSAIGTIVGSMFGGGFGGGGGTKKSSGPTTTMV